MMKSFLKYWWPHIILTLLVALIAWINYKPNTLLIGWDNLLPELNFPLNIQRSFFAVWQEYQGLGLLGGMGHASDLVRQLILLCLSIVIPTTFLRYFWTMAMLLLGALGAYTLIYFILDHVVSARNEETSDQAIQSRLTRDFPVTRNDNAKTNKQLLAFCGAVFYLLNLATLQTFYVPFEVFTAHFGFLPWLLYSTAKYVNFPHSSVQGEEKSQEQTRRGNEIFRKSHHVPQFCINFICGLRNILFPRQAHKSIVMLSLILLLATPGAYVPTLFVVYLMAVSILVGTLLIVELFTPAPPSPQGEGGNKEHSFLFLGERMKVRGKGLIKRIVILYCLIFLINAFWLLPFLYFTFTNSSVLINAKINQMATNKVFFQNLEFGNIFDVMLLRGFWYTNTNPDIHGVFVYMMGAWKTYSYNIFIELVGYLQFVVIFLGLLAGIRTKKPLAIAFGALCIFAFTVLATNDFPFSFVDYLLRTFVPLFQEAFRYTFTKFSLLAGLMYAVFFSLGLQVILRTVTRFHGEREEAQNSDKQVFTASIKNRFPSPHISVVSTIRNFLGERPYLIPLSGIISCCIVVFPIFLGYLFYPKEQHTLPGEYTQLINFFNRQDPTERIADFPQNEIWGWNFTTWGYEGSGFLWYAIPQPIMDRAFDVWSRNDENYYWELLNALYPPNASLLTNTLDKYQITWLVVDNNIVYPDKPDINYSQLLTNLFSHMPTIHKVQTFGNIVVYRYEPPQQPTKDVLLRQNLPTVNNYHWNNTDTAYQTYGAYQTESSNAITYPFRSLFTGKLQDDMEFTVQGKAGEIMIRNTLMSQGTTAYVHIPTMKDSVVRTTMNTTIAPNGALNLEFTYTTPQFFVDNKPIWQESSTQTIIQFPARTQFPLEVTVNGSKNYTITYQTQTLGNFFIYTKQDTILSLARGATHEALSLSAHTYKLPPIFSRDEIFPITTHKPSVDVVLRLSDLPSDLIDPAKDQGNFRNCNAFRNGSASKEMAGNLLRMTGINATPCAAYYAGNMYYDNGYLLIFPSQHITGQALHMWIDNPKILFSPLDTFLPTQSRQTTDYFVIPPTSLSGQGYGIHFDEDSYGGNTTENAFGTLAVYPLPYQLLTGITITTSLTTAPSTPDTTPITVVHPNESVYGVTFDTPSSQLHAPTTLILSQSYDSGWKLYRVPNMSWFWEAFPFFAGSALPNHIMVNNWENGWNLDAKTLQGGQHFIAIYQPQYLEYLGFFLLFATLGFLLWSFLSSRANHSKAHSHSLGTKDEESRDLMQQHQ